MRAVLGRARRDGPSVSHTCRKTPAELSENSGEFFNCLAKDSAEDFSVAADLKEIICKTIEVSHYLNINVRALMQDWALIGVDSDGAIFCID